MNENCWSYRLEKPDIPYASPMEKMPKSTPLKNYMKENIYQMCKKKVHNFSV